MLRALVLAFWLSLVAATAAPAAEITIAEDDARIQIVASSGQTAFTYDFPIFDADHLTVEVTNSAGTTSTLSRGGDYTVSGVGDAGGGTVTLTSGATAGDVYTIWRDVPEERLTDYATGGDFLASTVNRDFDLLAMQTQQLRRDIERSVRVASEDTATAADMELPDAGTRADQLLSFNSSGAVTVVSGADKSSDTVTTAGTSTARTLANRFADVINVLDYDDDSDGVIDQTEFQSAVDDLPTNGGVIFAPASGVYELGAQGANPYAVQLPSLKHVRLVGYGATIDVKLTEQTAGHGAAVFVWRGGSWNSSLIIEGFFFDGTNAGTNADAVWVDGAGSVFVMRDVTINGREKMRHGFVTTNINPGTDALCARCAIKDSNFVQLNDTAIIIQDSEDFLVESTRIRSNNGWGIEVGQGGDRSFVGSPLSGIASGYRIVSCTLERNHGGILVIEGRTGYIASDFEVNDEGNDGRPHIDLTGTGMTGGGDERGGTVANSTFGGTQPNIKVRDGSKLRDNEHKEGRPGILTINDTIPVLALTEHYDNIETKIGQQTDLIDTDNTGTFTVGESVTGGSSGAKGRVIGWDAGTNTLTISWQRTSPQLLFSTGEVVTGGTSGATLNNLDSISYSGKAGVIVGPPITLTLKEEAVADNATGEKVSPSFSLDHKAIATIEAGLEDGSAANDTGYQWTLRNVTDGSTDAVVFNTAAGHELGPTGGVDDWQARHDLRAQKADGKEYGIWVRNNAGGGSKNLTGFITFFVTQVNLD